MVDFDFRLDRASDQRAAGRGCQRLARESGGLQLKAAEVPNESQPRSIRADVSVISAA